MKCFIFLYQVQGRNCVAFIGQLLCVRNENSHNSPFVPLNILVWIVLMEGMEPSSAWLRCSGDWMSLTQRKKDRSGDFSAISLSLTSRDGGLILPLSFLQCLRTSKLPFFLTGLICSSVLCMGPSSCSNPIHPGPVTSSTHYCTLLSSYSLWNIRAFISS